jgi:single-strand DNA-binding protein
MANDLNVVALVGRLTRPCDMRYTNSGYAICSFTLAVNRRRKQQDGTWQDQASFFDCSYFGKAAEGVSQYLQKGQQIGVQGSLEQQSWEKDGQKRSKIAVIVDSLTLLGSAGGNNSRAPQQNAGGYQQSRQNDGFSQNQGQNNYASQQQFGNTQMGGNSTGGYYSGYNSGNSAQQPAPASSVVKTSSAAPVIGGPEAFDDDIPF